MKAKKIKVFKAQSALTTSELLDKIRRHTAEDFDTAKQNSQFQYYGKVSNNHFNIRNVKYGAHSAGHTIQGEVEEGANGKSTLKFSIDMHEYNSYVNTGITFALFVIGISVSSFTIVGQKNSFSVFSLAAIMIVFPFLYSLIIKQLSKSAEKDELKKLLTITESEMIES